MNFSLLVVRKIPSTRGNFLGSTGVCRTIICETSSNKKSHTSSSSSSSSSSDSDDDVLKKNVTKNDAVSRLNALLKQMTDETLQAASSLKLSRPNNKRVQGKEEKQLKESESAEKQVVTAIKNVAESLGGNTKQTESELLKKLLGTSEINAAASTSLSDIIKGMKIEREVKPPVSKADQVRSILQQVNTRNHSHDKAEAPRRLRKSALNQKTDVQPKRVDLFGSASLGIFTDKSHLKESPSLQTWGKLHEKELKLAVTHPPANYFQEMILWTEQGKFWQFPINNEIGLDEEANVYFADHVFLEEHLEGWCPPRGPIRHFMELVCVGLSKNPYLTVEAKKEHILWYKNYFEDKKTLLREIGAIETKTSEPRSISEE